MAKQRFTNAQTFAIMAGMAAGCVGLFLVLGGNPFAETAAEKADREAKKRPLDVSAEKLIDAYSENPLNADERFRGRWLRISGTVSTIGTEILGRPFVMLGGVQCVFGTEHKHAIAELRVGSEITATGKCGGRTLGIIILDDCEP